MVDIDFEKQIEEVLSGKSYMRREKVVEEMQKANINKTGYSKVSVERRISKLVKAGVLSKIEYKDLRNIGIKETDKRAVYLTLTKAINLKPHLDRVFRYLFNGTVDERKLALKEIETYDKSYTLQADQLDVLVSNLDQLDDELVNACLRIVFDNITKRKIHPKNTEKFLQALRNTLKRYPNRLNTFTNLKTHLIYLLGCFKDEEVINQLIRDANNDKRDPNFQHEYLSVYTAFIIEENRDKLFDLQRKLISEGKKSVADEIAQIRYQAGVLLKTVQPAFDDVFSDSYDDHFDSQGNLK